MKTILIRFSKRIIFSISVVLSCLMFFSSAQASHISGIDLVYEHLSGMQYRVTLRLYRDCSGIPVSNQEIISVSEGICGTDLVVPGCTLALAKRDTQDVFCAAYNPLFKCSYLIDPANPQRPSNFEITSYQGKVVLPYRSSNWCFSWNGYARPKLSNEGVSESSIYTYSMLDNLNFDNNNSPKFKDFSTPMPYVYTHQPFVHTFNAIDSDRDSVSYELDHVYSTCSTALGYSNMPAFSFSDSVNIPHSGKVSVPSASFAKDFPLPSYTTRFNARTGKNEAVPYFYFNARQGWVSFIPRVYHEIYGPSAGYNKYMLAVIITDWRRERAGFYRPIGKTRREILITVIPGESSISSLPPVLEADPKNFQNIISNVNSSEIKISSQTCQRTISTLKLQNVLSHGLSQTISVQGLRPDGRLESNPELGTIRVINNNSIDAKIELDLSPTIENTGRRFVIPIKCELGQCPVKSSQIYHINLDFVKSNLVAAVPHNLDSIRTSERVNKQIEGQGVYIDSICLGDVVFVKPLSARKSLPEDSINIRWLTTTGLEAVSSDYTAALRPIQHTTYTYIVSSSIGIHCSDTGRVVLRVFPIPTAPQLKVDTIANTLSIQNGVGETVWYLNDTLLPDIISSSIRPQKSGLYKAKIIVDGCSSTFSKSVSYRVPPSQDPPSVTVWPNPLASVLEFHHSTGKLLNVKLRDVTGRLVLDLNNLKSNTIDVSFLARGYYYISILTTTGIGNQKIIIEH